MCLGIPGQIVSLDDAADLVATVDVCGVRRRVNIACIVDEAHPAHACVGDWVLVHVGFAMSRLDADAAAETLRILDELSSLQEELSSFAGAAGAQAAE